MGCSRICKEVRSLSGRVLVCMHATRIVVTLTRNQSVGWGSGVWAYVRNHTHFPFSRTCRPSLTKFQQQSFSLATLQGKNNIDWHKSNCYARDTDDVCFSSLIVSSSYIKSTKRICRFRRIQLLKLEFL